MNEQSARHEAPLRPLLLPAPVAIEDMEARPGFSQTRPGFPQGARLGGQSRTRATTETQLEVVRAQRDGLARVQARLVARIRRLEVENEKVRKELERYHRYPPLEQQEEELAEAKKLEQERGIVFELMPDGVYPGKPYITQLDLIRHGITKYSRQNISRLTRVERAVPALPLADRMLLPPRGVKALLERERVAAADTSPRRRPGGKRPATRRKR